MNKTKEYRLITDRNKITRIVNNIDNPKDLESGWTMKSPAFDSVEELIEKKKILDEPCVICGSLISTTYSDDVVSGLKEKNLCFFCLFWSEWIEKKDDPNTVRIDGTHYHIAPDAPDAYFKGFGGRRFKIEFNDGRVVETRNLWCQGDISKHYKELLPDNAKFIQDNET